MPLDEPDGRLLCAGRGGARSAVAVLVTGRDVLLFTRDDHLDPAAPADGGQAVGLLRLPADLAVLPAPDDPDGAACGTLLLGGDGDQRPAQADALGAGAFAIAGVRTADGAPHRVFAALCDAQARLLPPGGALFPAPPEADTGAPLLAADGTGGFLLGWIETRGPTHLEGTARFGRYDAAGAPVWPGPVRISHGDRAWIAGGAAIGDGHGGVYAGFVETRDDEADPGPHLRLQHLDDFGRALWPEGGLRMEPERVALPPFALVPDPRGVLALFLSDVPRAGLFSAAGERLWGASGRPLAPPPQGRARSALAAIPAPDGGLYVVWIETGAEGDRLVARRLLRDGSLPWPEPATLLSGTGPIVSFAAAALDDASLVVAASLATTDPGGAPSDLAAGLIDRRGRVAAGPAGFDLCRAPGRQMQPRVFASGPPRQASFFWSDARPGAGAAGSDSYFVARVLFTTAPRLDPSPEPAAVPQGGEVAIEVAGDDLDPALTADLGPGAALDRIEVTPLRPEGPGDILRLRARLAAGAAVGPRTLRVRNPDGSTAEAIALDVRLDPGRVDLDGNGRDDGYDLARLAAAFGRGAGEDGYAQDADIDGSGVVDGTDLALLAARFGERIPAP